jgi:hypothetical protein
MSDTKPRWIKIIAWKSFRMDPDCGVRSEKGGGHLHQSATRSFPTCSLVPRGEAAIDFRFLFCPDLSVSPLTCVAHIPAHITLRRVSSTVWDVLSRQRERPQMEPRVAFRS